MESCHCESRSAPPAPLPHPHFEKPSYSPASGSVSPERPLICSMVSAAVRWCPITYHLCHQHKTLLQNGSSGEVHCRHRGRHQPTVPHTSLSTLDVYPINWCRSLYRQDYVYCNITHTLILPTWRLVEGRLPGWNLYETKLFIPIMIKTLIDIKLDIMRSMSLAIVSVKLYSLSLKAPQYDE